MTLETKILAALLMGFMLVTNAAYAQDKPSILVIWGDGATGDGWIRRPVSGAPPAEPFPVSEWIKLPKPWCAFSRR